jgi:hypothetical protein
MSLVLKTILLLDNDKTDEVMKVSFTIACWRQIAFPSLTSVNNKLHREYIVCLDCSLDRA